MKGSVSRINWTIKFNEEIKSFYLRMAEMVNYISTIYWNLIQDKWSNRRIYNLQPKKKDKTKMPEECACPVQDTTCKGGNSQAIQGWLTHGRMIWTKSLFTDVERIIQ